MAESKGPVKLFATQANINHLAIVLRELILEGLDVPVEEAGKPHPLRRLVREVLTNGNTVFASRVLSAFDLSGLGAGYYLIDNAPGALELAIFDGHITVKVCLESTHSRTQERLQAVADRHPFPRAT